LTIERFYFDAPKQLFAYWQSMAADGSVPAKRNLDPARIPKLLPFVWLCARDPERDTFVYNLAGEVIRGTLNRPIRGRSLDQIFNMEWSKRLNDRYRRVCEGPAMYHSYGGVYVVSEKHGVGERIILPLTGADGRVDHVLGLTYYLLHEKQTAPEAVLNAGSEERGEFVPLPMSATIAK